MQDAGYEKYSAAWWPLYRGAGGLRLKNFSESNIEILWWNVLSFPNQHMTCLRNLETNSLRGSQITAINKRLMQSSGRFMLWIIRNTIWFTEQKITSLLNAVNRFML